jgi:hypothetical protein
MTAELMLWVRLSLTVVSLGSASIKKKNQTKSGIALPLNPCHVKEIIAAPNDF